jgi:hypothetical protein
LFAKEIAEGKCFDINYELIKVKTEEELIVIKKFLNKTHNEIEYICKNCPNYPL